jgi:predicted O-methyltransferase YrrM
VSVLRLRDRPAYYRSRLIRELSAAARWPRIRRAAPDIAHLAMYDEITWGSVQRDEALVLHALVRAVRPQTVLEIGFLHGDSAFNFLCALDEGARLYSFDTDPESSRLARERFGHDPRLVFRSRSQDELTADDLDGHRADFVFLDGAHELDINQTTFDRLLPLMTDEAIVAVHDTGTIPRKLTPSGHWTLELSERWVDDEYEHQPDERAFVNWLLDEHPEFSQIHLHTGRAFRHGMTLLQRREALKRPASA